MNIDIDITNVVLKSERIVLRPFNENDLNDLYEYAKVEGVGENAGWCHHKDISESKRILDMFIEGKKTFAITLNNKVIGSFGIEQYSTELLKEFDELKGREIGYVLSKDYWGMGIMTECVKAVLDYLFNDLDLDFVVAGHFKDNERSARVQDKFNFKCIKEFLYTTRYDVIKETLIRVLTKEDYLKEDYLD